MKWMCVLASFGLLCFVQGYDDSRCSNRDGRCQNSSSIPCYQGQYHNGLCGGPVSRRCCIEYDDSKCSDREGRCQYMSSPCNGGRYHSGLCGGAGSRRCCIEYDDGKCRERNGRCQFMRIPCSDGEYHSGLCEGPNSRRCCIEYDDSRCYARRGRCQDSSSPCSDGQYHSGLCDGPSSRRCCVEYDDSRCNDRGGQCRHSSLPCSGDNLPLNDLCEGSSRQCCIPSEGDDSACSAKGGVCQTVYGPPCDGFYFNNLCSGPSDRRCCVPQPEEAPCPGMSEMACELFRSKNVVAARRHPSGQRDNAYPYNNLRDMCNGKQASRSSYNCGNGCHAPGGTTCLSFNMLTYLISLKNTSLDIRINELAGACHSCMSRHYSGLAVDLHRPSPDRGQLYIDQCLEYGGWALNESTHVHCQFYDWFHPNWE